MVAKTVAERADSLVVRKVEKKDNLMVGKKAGKSAGL